MGLIIISSGLELLWAGFSCVGVNSLFSSHIHEIHELVLDRLDSIKNYEVVVKFLPNKLSKQGFQTSFAYSFQTMFCLETICKACLETLFGQLVWNLVWKTDRPTSNIADDDDDIKATS